MIQPLMQLGTASVKITNTGKAKAHFRRALKIAAANLSDAEHAALLSEAGTSLLLLAGSRDSGSYLEKAYNVLLSAYGKSDTRTALAGIAFSRYQMADRNPESAEALLKQSLSVIGNDSNYLDDQRAAMSLLVELYESRGMRDEATPYCQAIGQMRPFTKGQDFQPIVRVAPPYPHGAITAGKEGYVVVEYVVDEYGYVQDPKVVESTGHVSFRAASMETIGRFRYAPAYVDGKAIPIEGVRNLFNFEFR